jgi:hypothetical protein
MAQPPSAAEADTVPINPPELLPENLNENEDYWV